MSNPVPGNLPSHVGGIGAFAGRLDALEHFFDHACSARAMHAVEDALFDERYLLDSLLRNVPDAIYFKDARGRFIRTNPAMARRLGLRDPAEAEGKTALEVPGYELALRLHREDEAVLRTGRPQYDKLERGVTPEGKNRYDLVTRLPLRDRDERIVGIIVIFRDVTEQKLAEQKIHEAVRRRDRFLAMLSHELRHPLSAIVTATALLERDGAAACNRDKYLCVLERQSAQMSRLLDDLLDASRVTQNKIALEKRIVDLRAVARDAADAIRPQMDARSIELTLELDPAPIHVDGDPARLQQIHVNLLNNAAKYTSAGGHVRLSVGREGEHAVLRVKDDGAGIPPHMLDSVFDLFVQSSRTLDCAAGGLGLGLTVVRSLVALHGGTVAAYSEGEGRGSEFVVRLPLAAVQIAARVEHPGRCGVPATRGPRLRRST